MTQIRVWSKGLYLLIVVTLLALGLAGKVERQAKATAEASRYFPETKQTIAGKFLAYWQANGGLPVYGYPITEARMEVDPETGKTFLTQWFERNRFELHPENTGTQYEVLLGLLGKDLRREALTVDPDFKPLDNPRLASQTWFTSRKSNTPCRAASSNTGSKTAASLVSAIPSPRNTKK